MTARERIEAFCLKHKLIFEEHGEVGFGRECVGLLSKRGGYLDFNPFSLSEDDNFAPIAGLQDKRMYAPVGIDAYHKHECFAVMVTNEDYGEAIRQLAAWVEYLESLGDLQVVDYETGATGMQVMMSGLVGYALKVKEAAHGEDGEGKNGDGEEEKAESQEADSSEEEASASGSREAGAREETDSR